MKKFLFAGALALLVSCAGGKSDVEVITDFYKAVLGETEMTDGLLQESLSQPVLDALWEADYADTYSYWAFRTGCQDGPSQESSLEDVKPLGDGWYQVTYSDLGIPGITDVRVEDGKICDYRPFSVPFELAHGYFLRNDVQGDACPKKITNQEELLQYFGMAAVMGKNGEPTAIDFDKSFVIPVIYPDTDQETSIVVDRFWRTGPESLTLSVSSIVADEHLSFTIRPIQLLIVDSFYRDFTLDYHQD